MSFTLRKYQEEATEACLSILNTKKGSCKELVVLPTGCHEKGYNIKMYDGTLKQVQDIELEDKIMGPDGTPRNVKRLVTGKGKLYKISPFFRGVPFYVNEDHILYLEATTVKKSQQKCYPKNVEVSVKEYLGWAKSRKHLYKLKKKSAENAYENNTECKIDPYYLGLYLGDGSKNSCDITTMDEEVKNYLKSMQKTEGVIYKEKPKHRENKAVTISLTTKIGQPNPLRNALKEAGVLTNKFIPKEFKNASLEIRKKLLEGILDSDGYSDERGRVEISFANKRLAYDTAEVLNSVGLYTNVKEGTSVCTNCEDKRTRPRYRICYSSKNILKPKVERRKYKGNISSVDSSRTGFRIEYDREDNYYGFTVDKDNLYLDWQFFVHHNCGKSLIQAEVAKRLDYPLLICVPSKELLLQNSKKLTEFGVNHTICSASAGSRDISNLTLATIGSIKNNWQEFKKLGVKGILLDEGHLSVKSGSVIRKFIKKAGIERVCALTATPVVLESSLSGASLKMLNRVKWRLYTGIRYVYQIHEAVANNYWSPLLYNSIQSDNTILQDNSNGSDYTLESQKRFYKANDINGKIKEELEIIQKQGRKCTMIFVPTIEEAESLYKMIPNSAIVHSKMKKSERDYMVSSFTNLKIPVIINCGVLQIGYDNPLIDSIIQGKPTKSVNLYYQIIGRGCRLHKDKKDCLITDMVGNYERFGRVEDFTFEDVPYYGTGMFGKDGVLLTDFPIKAKHRPTKETLIKRGKDDLKKKENLKNPMFTYGMFKGRRLFDIAKSKDAQRLKNYTSWIYEKHKKGEWNFFGEEGRAMKEAIEEYLMIENTNKKLPF